MTAPSYAVSPPKRLGGALCLDFVNTVEWRGDPEEQGERLTGYGELLLWARAQGLLSRAEARLLRREAERRPEAARAVLGEAVALREALARLLLPARGTATEDLELVNGLLRRAPARQALQRESSGFSWRLDPRDDLLAGPLWPVLWDAADLLTSTGARRVRRCADRRCGWLFLDQSRNRGRRWCSMRDCGNRAKARRHYARTRGSG